MYIILYIQTQITDKIESLFSNPRREHTKQCILYNVSRLLMSGNFRHERQIKLSQEDTNLPRVALNSLSVYTQPGLAFCLIQRASCSLLDELPIANGSAEVDARGRLVRNRAEAYM